jgi:hypothetical protein
MIRFSSLNVFIFILALSSVACAGQGASASSTKPPTTGGTTAILQQTIAPPAGTTVRVTANPAAGTPDSTPESSAVGDIPDTATFLNYHAKSYSLQYVEGWAQEQLPNDGIRIADKDSFVMVTLQSLPVSGSLADYAGGAGTAQSTREFGQFAKGGVKPLDLPAGHAALLTFKGLSAPDPVTSKRVLLDVDRYYIAGSASLAVLTEATPSGVDNVDAFLQIAKSFTWSAK